MLHICHWACDTWRTHHTSRCMQMYGKLLSSNAANLAETSVTHILAAMHRGPSAGIYNSSWQRCCDLLHLAVASRCPLIVRLCCCKCTTRICEHACSECLRRCCHRPARFVAVSRCRLSSSAADEPPKGCCSCQTADMALCVSVAPLTCNDVRAMDVCAIGQTHRLRQ